MKDLQRDIWAEWLLKGRFGGNADQMKATMEYLYQVRDKILFNVNLGENQTLIDVGCGDGLIGFGALEKSKTSRVIFSDISQDLLNQSQTIAEEMGVLNRCQFVTASAEDLSMIEDESVEAVTTRSVLIYVAAKQKALDEFYRVLKLRGTLSVFEPINTFKHPVPPHIFWGYDVTPFVEIAEKLKAVYHRIQPPGRDPMLDFDERDLMEFTESAGFREVHLNLEAKITPKSKGRSPFSVKDWDTFLRIAGNPNIPTLAEAMREALTPTEKKAFIAHLRPLVESKQGIDQSAFAYLWAVR